MSSPPQIPQKIYFRIGEVARIVDVAAHVIRFWETEFRILRPQKSRTGQRIYARRDVERLVTIKRLLKEERYTIEGARKFLETRLKTESARPAKAVKPAKVQAELFDSAPSALSDSMLQDIRKELRQIADMLK